MSTTIQAEANPPKFKYDQIGIFTPNGSETRGFRDWFTCDTEAALQSAIQMQQQGYEVERTEVKDRVVTVYFH